MQEYQEWLKDRSFAQLANPEETLLDVFMKEFDLKDRGEALKTLQVNVDTVMSDLAKHPKM